MSQDKIYYSKVPFSPHNHGRYTRLPGLVNRFRDLVETAKKHASEVRSERTMTAYYLEGERILEVDVYGSETTTHIHGIGRTFEAPDNHSYYDIDAASLAKLEDALRKIYS